MAAAGVFGFKTLNDNWYEDRHQPASGLTATAGFVNRKARPHETDIAYIGDRYDVLSRLSRMPERQSYATPDDGFRENQRTSSVDFAHPKSRKEFVSKPPEKARLVNAETVPEVSFEERRPVPGCRRGFGSVLDRHEENHEARYWNTTTGDHFGHTSKAGVPRANPVDFHTGAGYDTARMESVVEGVKVGQLCGENFTVSHDPGVDTKTQRAWLYQKDPSLTNVHLGGTRPVLPHQDSALSLPLGAGAMSKVRADLAERKGRLYRTATHITKGLGKRPGVAIFQDHAGVPSSWGV